MTSRVTIACDPTAARTPQNDPLRLWLRSAQPRPIQPGNEAQRHKRQLCHFDLTEAAYPGRFCRSSRSAWLDRTHGRISLPSPVMSPGRPTNRLRCERGSALPRRLSGRFTAKTPPVSLLSLHRGHGSLRGRKAPAATSGPKHRHCNVHNGLTRMYVRPNGHPRSLPAPSPRWATHHPRLRSRANVSLQDKVRDFAGPRRSGARWLC